MLTIKSYEICSKLSLHMLFDVGQLCVGRTRMNYCEFFFFWDYSNTVRKVSFIVNIVLLRIFLSEVIQKEISKVPTIFMLKYRKKLYGISVIFHTNRIRRVIVRVVIETGSFCFLETATRAETTIYQTPESRDKQKCEPFIEARKNPNSLSSL